MIQYIFKSTCFRIYSEQDLYLLNRGKNVDNRNDNDATYTTYSTHYNCSVSTFGV